MQRIFVKGYVKKKYVALFNGMVWAFCREKSRLEKSRCIKGIPWNTKKCPHHSVFKKIILICPDPSSPNIMLQWKIMFFFHKGINLHFEESFSTAFSISRIKAAALLNCCWKLCPRWFRIQHLWQFRVGQYPTKSNVAQLQGYTSTFEQATIQKIQAFQWGLPGWAGLPNRIPEARR